jgi:hypothetical protein
MTKEGQVWSYIDNDNNIKKKEECSICKGPIEPQRTPDNQIYWTYGHNADPVTDGQCCDLCNTTEVIPARIKQMQGG